MERRLAAILATDMVGYSRLMEADQSGTISRQKAHRRELIDPEIERNRGAIIKTTGDGLLVVFPSATDAVRAAIDIQRGMVRRERESTEETRIRYRVGINVGDVVFDEGDVFGGAVNVASRLESMSEPGGVCVSDVIYHLVEDSLDEPFKNLGSQRVKNITRPVLVWQWTPDTDFGDVDVVETPLNQRVQFCIAPDGVQIAYARVGEGPPLLKAPNWLNHIEYEWRSAVWGPFLAGLAKNHELVRFDQRGGGLSDWEVEDISEAAMVSDMATVVEAAKLEHFALFGVSQGCSFSIRYAVEHPEKVRCLVLLGGFARGALNRSSREQEKLFEASQTMITEGWGSKNPVYRQFFTAGFIPDATSAQKSGFDELQRVSVGPDNLARINRMNALVDTTELARRLRVPTLVLHSEGDRRVPLEEGRRLAALIPDARFVALKGNNHALVEGTPSFDRFFEEVHAFLKEHDS
ncbi:alpha/beta fold hydrolase [Tateyamaria pelophila]|uniref:alpha/beta fold hydrolase n=1 Tax=Tateyamaria pelophila TaxID=328415 RepID=UPI001CBC14EF|nr:alpha/beta fold hydrolase [Tateyamaria pelophila]